MSSEHEPHPCMGGSGGLMMMEDVNESTPTGGTTSATALTTTDAPATNQPLSSNNNDMIESPSRPSHPLMHHIHEDTNMQTSPSGPVVISPTTAGTTTHRNYFSSVREKYHQQQQQQQQLLSLSPPSQPTQNHPQMDTSSSASSIVPPFEFHRSTDSPPTLTGHIIPQQQPVMPFASSAAFMTSNSTASSSNTNFNVGSPNANKRHITTVLNPYTQNFRVHSPSPPKSPVRNNLFSQAVANSVNNAVNTNGTNSPQGSPLKRNGSNETNNASPIRSPVRLGGPMNNGHLSASPTRSAMSHGLPASPRTPSRRPPSSSASPSPAGNRTSPAPPPRSPIRPFYFPTGVPASPASRLTHQATVLQLSVHEFPDGFDQRGLGELIKLVIKLPKFVAPYVAAQCLAVQQGKRELRQAVLEKKQQRIRQRKLAAAAKKLSDSKAKGATKNLFGTIPTSLNGDAKSPHQQQNMTSNEMSIDSLLIASNLHHDSLTSPERRAMLTANGHLISPMAGPVGRDRNISTTSTSSSNQTVLSQPASPANLTNTTAAPTPTELNVNDTDTAQFLTPPSISRLRSPSEPNASINSSLLQLSDADLGNETEDEALEADEEDERILPQTFLYYFTHFLEKFRDPDTRFFRILSGEIGYLLDVDTPSSTTSVNGTNEQINVTMDTISSPSRPSSFLSPTVGSHGLNMLQIPSPHTLIPLATPLSPASTPSPIPSPSSTAYLTKEHFQPLMESILASHPGLQFLSTTPEFQVKYAQTCIARIFYSLSPRGSNRLTLTEIKRSKLLEELVRLDEEDDINLSLRFFSYQHFYVLYCKFWELDSPDHDGFLSLSNLYDYENGALSARMCQRIISCCEKTKDDDIELVEGETQEQLNTSNLSATSDGFNMEVPPCDLADSELHVGRMSYEQFIPFFLSEVDKSTPQAGRFWFKLLDIDHDHVLSLYELDYWFKDQLEKIQALSTDTIRWNDIVCQVLDMIKVGGETLNSEGKMHAHLGRPPIHQQHPHPLPPAMTSSAFVRSNSDPLHRTTASSSILGASSIPFEFSSCHITQKDLARSKMQSYFYNMLFNLPKFLQHESRDPVKSRIAHENEEKGISEWEAYATWMYQSLIQNEEIQARSGGQNQFEVQMNDDEEEFQQEQQVDHQGLMSMDSEVASSAPHHQQHHHHTHLHCDEEDLMEEDNRVGPPTAADAVMIELDEVDETVPASSRLNSNTNFNHLNDETREFMQHRFQSNPIDTNRSNAQTTSHVAYEVLGSGGFGSSMNGQLLQHPSENHTDTFSNHQGTTSPPTLVATTQHPPATQPQAFHPFLTDAAARLKAKQEEQDYLELQRKIHSHVDDDPDSPRAASPAASSKPINIPSPSHSPFQRFPFTCSDSTTTTEPSTSLSPPEEMLSTAPRSITNVPASMKVTAMQMEFGQHQQGSPIQQQIHPGKENALPLSPNSTNQFGTTGSGFKRQLTFTAPTKPTPLSPTPTMQSQQQTS